MAYDLPGTFQTNDYACRDNGGFTSDPLLVKPYCAIRDPKNFIHMYMSKYKGRSAWQPNFK